MSIKRYIKHHIVFSIMTLDKLSNDISTTHELYATSEEKQKLLNDIARIRNIVKQIKDLEVNDTRFGMERAGI